MAVLPAFLISVLAIGSISVIGILIAGKTTGEKFGFQKVQVAVVIPDHSQTTEMLMNLIAGMDSTAAICDFNYLSEQEAYKQLEAEMVDAVIKVNLIGFVPEAVRGQLGVEAIGLAEFFSLLYIAYEIISILKNMALCGLPVKEIWVKVKGVLSKYTTELPDDE